MTHSRLDPSDLLDQPPLAPAELVRLEQLAAHVLGTAHDVIVVQAEAILALEAVARGVASPSARAINVLTGPYGAIFGGWMREAGAAVTDVASPFDATVTVDAVADAIATVRPAVLAIVHAEAATGGTNPLADILAIARSEGVLTVVDAVASVGAEPLPADHWGADVVVLGAQKGLAGPAGVSAVSISPAAWDRILANPAAPRESALSLLDQRERWLQTDRSLIPGMPATLESRAFDAALDRALAEGIDRVQDRHRRASAATLLGAAALGLQPWQTGPDGFAPVVTTLRLPSAGLLGEGALGGILSPGNGPLRGQLLRVNHTGLAASQDAVDDAIRRLARALGTDPEPAIAAAATAW